METRHESTSKIKARVIAQSYTSRVTYACRYFVNNYVIGHDAIVGKAVSTTVVRSDDREKVTIYKSQWCSPRGQALALRPIFMVMALALASGPMALALTPVALASKVQALALRAALTI